MLEKPGAVTIVNYASVTIISNQRKTYIMKDINFINLYTEKSHFAKNIRKCIFDRIYEFTTTLPRSNPRPVVSCNQSQTQLDLQRPH